MGLGGQGDHHQARGIHVEAMDDKGTSEAFFDSPLYAVLGHARAPWRRQKTRRFVYDGDVVVGVNDLEFDPTHIGGNESLLTAIDAAQ